MRPMRDIHYWLVRIEIFSKLVQRARKRINNSRKELTIQKNKSKGRASNVKVEKRDIEKIPQMLKSEWKPTILTKEIGM